MTLESYIKDLLYRYNCVIVPNFGGFISNNKSAFIKGNAFNPPYKQLTFNSLLQNNDGLLANHIATTDKMPYETAVNFINFEVEMWIEKLMDNDLNLHGIGSFSMENDRILFEPDTRENYLTSSFGLGSYIANSVQRNLQDNTIIQVENKPAVYREQVAQLEEKSVIALHPKSNKKASNFLKYAAIFVLGSSLIGLLGTKMYQNNMNNQQIVKITEQQKARENQIHTATFVIESPLPTIVLSSSIPVMKYHIIAGAFRSEINAHKKKNQLSKNGFDAKIVGVNNWNLTQVAFQSFSNLEEANIALATIKKTVSTDAWLLIK